MLGWYCGIAVELFGGKLGGWEWKVRVAREVVNLI